MKNSLRKKAILVICCIVVFISILIVLIYNRGLSDVIRSQYEERSIEIAKLVANRIDAERLSRLADEVLAIYEKSEQKVMSDQWGTPAFEAYVSQFAWIEETEDYQAVHAELRKMQDMLDVVDCLYLTWLDAENECYIYLVDASYEDVCPVGCIDPLYAEDVAALKDPAAGLLPNITNTREYGWLIATGMPVFDASGRVIAYADVDISMNEVLAGQHRFMNTVVIAFLAMTFLACLLALFLIERMIIRPVNRLSKAAASYRAGQEVFSGLPIGGDDEIGVLASSMAGMEKEINEYIASLERTTGDLLKAREYADEMDRAANIDALTKVRNKRAYDTETVRLDAGREPYALLMIDMNGLKQINDSYGHEKGDISIHTLCRIICRVCRYAPVYRMGGDEFVVLLEGSDYEEREFLCRTLKKALADNGHDLSLPPWERVSAAVGSAVCNRGARERAQSVLKRADAAMYTDKKSSKAG